MGFPYLSDRHRTACTTALHILEHTNDLYGWEDIYPRVWKFLNMQISRPHYKWKKNLPRRFFIQLWAIYQMLLLVRMGNARGINFVIRILYSTVYLHLLDIFFTFCSKKYLLNFQIHGCLFNLQIIEHLSGNKTVQRDDKKNYRFFFTKTQVDLFFYSWILWKSAYMY